MRALPAPGAASGPQPPADPQAGRRSAVERLAADRSKYVRSLPGPEAGPGRGSGGCPASPDPGPPGAPGPRGAPVPVARRAIQRRPLRPDSLVIYRQKCEFARGLGADGARAGLVKKPPQAKAGLAEKPLQAPAEDRAPDTPRAARAGAECAAGGREAERTEAGREAVRTEAGREAAEAPARSPTVPPAAQAGAAGRELRPGARGGLRRSQSDLSSRCAAAAADVDAFFQHCGLDPEVVEALGRENFSAGSDGVALKVRSVSVATSDCGFSRHGSWEDDALLAGLGGQVPSATSVVERNARIIKWLYACQKAQEPAGPAPRGPQEANLPDDKDP